MKIGLKEKLHYYYWHTDIVIFVVDTIVIFIIGCLMAWLGWTKILPHPSNITEWSSYLALIIVPSFSGAAIANISFAIYNLSGAESRRDSDNIIHLKRKGVKLD